MNSTPTTMMIEVYFLGQEREIKGRKRVTGDKPITFK
jgi:hypothetical protein